MKLELTLNHRRLDVNSGDVLTNPELVIIDFRSRYKGDSGVYYGNDPTEYDDVWIDPDGSVATADDILTKDGESVQQNIDSINLSITETNEAIAEIVFKLPNTLPVKVTGTAAAPAFAFTKADFDTVAKSYANGAQIFVDIADNRSAANKPIDLSARYDAMWNKALSQIEVRDTNVARGFYLDGTTPSSRGCVTCDTAKYIDAGAEFDATQGVYYLNGISLTESDIRDTYEYTYGAFINSDWSEVMYGSTLKTNFFAPLNNASNKGAAAIAVAGGACFSSSSVVNVRISANNRETYLSNLVLMFNNTRSMQKVLGVINCNSTSAFISGVFQNSSISSFKWKRISASTSLSTAPNIDRDSIMYMVNNSANGATNITITLHPTALSRLTPEDIALASSKNITLTA